MILEELWYGNINPCELGKCLETTKGLMWCVKRYTDDEIVLQGCGDDEYTYRRTDKRTEQFAAIQNNKF